MSLFNIGDIVALKSGGMPMTVVAFGEETKEVLDSGRKTRSQTAASQPNLRSRNK